MSSFAEMIRSRVCGPKSNEASFTGPRGLLEVSLAKNKILGYFYGTLKRGKDVGRIELFVLVNKETPSHQCTVLQRFGRLYPKYYNVDKSWRIPATELCMIGT